MIVGNTLCRVCLFLFRARRDDAAWLFPAKRSNAALDESRRAMNTVFPTIMGINRQVKKQFNWNIVLSEYLLSCFTRIDKRHIFMLKFAHTKTEYLRVLNSLLTSPIVTHYCISKLQSPSLPLNPSILLAMSEIPHASET